MLKLQVDRAHWIEAWAQPEFSLWGALMSIRFTALHGMQTRSSDENSVRLSVCLSVCQTLDP